MRFLYILLIVHIFLSTHAAAQAPVPQQSLNHYVNFLNASTAVVTSRFEMLVRYYSEAEQYKKKPGFGLRLPSSGPLEEYYYKTARESTGLKPQEKKMLNAEADTIWQTLNKLDEAAKSLETYVRLEDYPRDQFKKSDALIRKMQVLFETYAGEKDRFYERLSELHKRYHPAIPDNPYSDADKIIRNAIAAQKMVLTALPFYLNENTKAELPAPLLQQSLLDDAELIKSFEAKKSTAKEQDPGVSSFIKSQLKYPASSAFGDIGAAIASMQDLKRHALDENNFSAKQSAKHGNAVYMRLLKQYNQDLLVMQKSFVNYAQADAKLLFQSLFSPVMRLNAESGKTSGKATAEPFRDQNFPPLTLKKSPVPASAALIENLNNYIDFINESLRQMHLQQVLLRNYQSSAEYYRDPEKAQKRANLTYDHKDFKLPVSDYAMLNAAAASLPKSARPVITGQAEVLMEILKEMDRLSIELIGYTTEKQYLKDRLERSDAILERYLFLFDVFDKKKEQLYRDIRTVHEAYPNAMPASSWFTAGNAMLKTMDNAHDVLFGIKDFLKQKAEIPATAEMETNARQLIADEYKNMKGLQRYGRSNGLCPYSPYEDLGANALRFAEKTQKVKTTNPGSYTHPFESFYYFYNNELVYQYNKFIELSKAGLLKTINQPDLFVFQKTELQSYAQKPVSARQAQVTTVPQDTHESRPPQTEIEGKTKTSRKAKDTANQASLAQDTVYVERVRIDTVYVDRNASPESVTRSLDGFAPNNMVLLLDVSSSMNAPAKMPLLKRSIKSLLTLLRPEDQISIVLYSGKARVALKPTSGSRAAEIARMIDLLKSDGDTDGNNGIKLAYKTASKDYLRGGNNRIVLATDGEFPVSGEVMNMIEQHARQDIYLSVFTFGKNLHTGQKLRKLSELGKGSFAHVTDASADLQLILEAQARRAQ